MVATLIETVPVFDVYTDGIARCDVFGGAARITYFSFQIDVARPSCKPCRIVCAKMVWSVESLLRHGGRLGRFIADGKSGEWPEPVVKATSPLH